MARGGVAAALVAAGILLSRLAGLVRERAFAHVFGAGDEADVFRAAFRIPNMLQNLLGEGALSASFIPAYARLERDDPAAAARLAGAVLSLLLLASAVLVGAGMLAAPWLVDVVAPGFQGQKRELAVRCVELFFPAMGLLVPSAWCLGVLNTHGRFFAAYAAPVAFNLVMIGVLLLVDAGDRAAALLTVAGATIAAALAQLGVQLPFVAGHLRGMAPRAGLRSPHLRAVAGNFLPALLSRGVVQLSAFVESAIASLLPTGAVAALGYAQVLYTLPASLFAQAVVASELPELSRGVRGGGRDEALPADVRTDLCTRIAAAQARIAFLVVPSAVAFLCLGGALATLLFGTGRFGADEARLVWLALGGAAVGLVAGTQARLLASACYALGDTRRPLHAASARVAIGGSLGFALSQWLPEALRLPALAGIACITAASSLAAILEWRLLVRALRGPLPELAVQPADAGRVLLAAALAGAAGLAVSRLPDSGPLGAVAGVVAFATTYAAATLALRVTFAHALVAALRTRLRRGNNGR